jgi:hypothetical protein
MRRTTAESKAWAGQTKQTLRINRSLTAPGPHPYGLHQNEEQMFLSRASSPALYGFADPMKTNIIIVLFVGLVVGLVMGIVVGAGAAWMLAAHINGQISTDQPLTAEEDQVDVAQNTPWTSSEVAAADSVEGQVRSQGKRWGQITGEITVGAYVQDILEGRRDQPKGRGAIGKVVSLSTGNNEVPAAMVDFGHGYSVGINLSELTLVSVVPGGK